MERIDAEGDAGRQFDSVSLDISSDGLFLDVNREFTSAAGDDTVTNSGDAALSATVSPLIDTARPNSSPAAPSLGSVMLNLSLIGAGLIAMHLGAGVEGTAVWLCWAVLLGAVLRLPPVKRTLAAQQVKSRFLEALITRASEK